MKDAIEKKMNVKRKLMKKGKGKVKSMKLKIYIYK